MYTPDRKSANRRATFFGVAPPIGPQPQLRTRSANAMAPQINITGITV
jgi:hypothetical protein